MDEGGFRNGAPLCERFHEMNLEGVLCTGEPERYVKQSSEMNVRLHSGPAFREHGWALLSSSLLIRGNFMRFLRDMQYAF